MRNFLLFHSPMPYLNLKPDFITVQSNPTRVQLFVIILYCEVISCWSQRARDVSAVLNEVDYFILAVDT